MTAEIITIGDELLIGQVTDTNSVWISRTLEDHGFRVMRKQTVGDDEPEILRALRESEQRVDVVLLTGGLGPTKDDVTLNALCKHFDTARHFSTEVHEHNQQLFAERGVEMNDLTRDQAMVPDNATVSINEVGTAPCTWFERRGCMVISMPGVPMEMKWLMTNRVIPRLQEYYGRKAGIAHRTCWVTGYTESALAMTLADFERDLPDEVRLAYLPQPGLIRLRLSAYCSPQAVADRVADVLRLRLRTILKEHIIAEEDLPIEALLGRRLQAAGLTVGTAESCTGGAIAAAITSVAGSSAYFKGGIVSYTDEVKRRTLGVSAADLESVGAVSQPVVEQMARGAREALGCDLAVATSGFAGPSGGTPEAPVGTVWIAVATSSAVVSKEYHFGAARDHNISRAVNMALLMLFEMAATPDVQAPTA